ncbi:MAG: hypothetical protein A3I66_04600 [Burkholderiales bacterium RIFCSPLOWO2_02_FULL_57_36]|nr:MAG: hypothetical protein A3I66_04600 [Burkholderiales bacterium RIFCSPLOWO2_02_FULL_57_36]
MSLLKYTKMPFSFHEGWDQVFAERPSVLKTFLFLVLPFSMIAPAMLMYAGNHHASAYLMDPSLERWKAVALTFFVGELLTVPLMGVMIRQVAAVHKLTADFRDTFLLAAIVSIPMCMSSLGLAVPDLWTMIGIVVLGFAIAAALLYHGTYHVLELKDPIQAQALSAEVFAAGALMWALLAGFVLLTLMR